MINLVLLSACVSLVTLAILFIQRIRPQKMKIPSYFLGEFAHRKLLKLQTRPPRWWEWVLVLCVTGGAALAYFSKTLPETEGQTRGQGLFWFDPTLSHVLALQQNESVREGLIESLRDMSLSEYVFAELTFSNSADAEGQIAFNLKKIKPAELTEYVSEKLQSPSALSQPMDSAQLIRAVKQELAADPARLTLTLITDAQSETLRALSSLSPQFESVKVLRTPRHPESAVGRRSPVIPEELATAWTPRKAGESEEIGLPGTPQFVKVEGVLARFVPPQARPSLSLEEWVPENRENQNPNARAVRLFVGEDSHLESVPLGQKQPPLLTTCTLDVAGPSELDGLSDLRAYAQFFKIPIRPLACRTTESALSAKKADVFDPWKFRRASLWVVPVNDYVAGQLFQQGVHWIPEGFAPETDALIYIADTRMQGSDSLLESLTIQLEENQPSLRLPLLPLPPERLVFPWELGAQETRPRSNPIALKAPLTSTSPSAAHQNEAKGPLLRASDGTPLAFSLSTEPPVVYLRTGGAAQNGDLGRWGQWAALWNNLTTKVESRAPLLTRVQVKTPREWNDWLEQQKKVNAPALRYKIQTETLKGAMVEKTGAPLPPFPALYIRERDDQMVLIEPPAEERQSEVLSLADLDQLFPQHAVADSSQGNKRPVAAPSQILGASFALLSALLLWFLQRNASHRQATELAKTGLSLFALMIALQSSVGFAQGNPRSPVNLRTNRPMENRPDTLTHPFRIAWCEAQIPPEVQRRYSQLQALLAGRGTIDLPKDLSAGACRVGAAEIWWTSSLADLQAAPVTQHIRSGGLVIAEGITLSQTPEWMLASSDPSIGLVWESPKRRGLLYRSFYLLSSFDGCSPERTLVLTLRKKVNAQAPMGIVTPVRFLTHTSEGADCFLSDDDYRTRSFVNLMYALLTTDYKEDQMQLPEILNRVRNLGLEP